MCSVNVPLTYLKVQVGIHSKSGLILFFRIIIPLRNYFLQSYETKYKISFAHWFDKKISSPLAS